MRDKQTASSPSPVDANISICYKYQGSTYHSVPPSPSAFPRSDHSTEYMCCTRYIYPLTEYKGQEVLSERKLEYGVRIPEKMLI
ncbi:hypothetical protein BJY04DRAFT_201411 [Aspergillus karnatakaensis]|uniref:uncharacterized protein n=1 Tax=Aspergillus karnatakaensis TaxID=1810916 RepID=UPI003CCCDD3E